MCTPYLSHPPKPRRHLWLLSTLATKRAAATLWIEAAFPYSTSSQSAASALRPRTPMKSYAPGAATFASLLDVNGDALVLEAGLFLRLWPRRERWSVSKGQ